MKILLIGEFSSLHNYLKQGLLKIGHEVTLVSNGDSKKSIPGADYKLYNDYSSGIRRKIDIYIKPLFKMRKFIEYDVVHFISPYLFDYRIRKFIFNRLIKKNRLVSLSASGGDLALKKSYESGKLDYYMYDVNKTFNERYSNSTKEGKFNILFEEKFIDKVDIIIPSLYEYSLGYTHTQKVRKILPFPINIEEIEYKNNIVRDKIVFLHGITREDAKGTKYIREAFDKLIKKYPNEVEVVISDNMPFKEYLKYIERSNVIVDQCKSYGYGINACISMAKGKVVMSGVRKEVLDAYNIKKSPIILAKPDSDFLFKQMEYIVQNKQNILQWGLDSRKYIEENHNYIEIAKKYIETWKGEMEK